MKRRPMNHDELTNLTELQNELTVDVKGVATKADFERVFAKWADRVRPPMSLESLILIGHSNKWI